MPFSNNPQTRLLVTVMLIAFMAIPLTVFFAKQQQDTRQRAAEPTPVPAITTVPQPPSTEDHVKGQLIVKVKKDVSDEELTDTTATPVDLTVEDNIEPLQTKVVKVEEGKEQQAIQELKKDPDVLYVEPEVEFSIDDVPNDTDFTKQYALTTIGAPSAWEKSRGTGIKIAVIDTGIDLDHPDLAGNIFLSKNFTDAATPDDGNGHGTHVAGIIASITGNALGTAGTCPDCKLLNARVLNDDGKGTCSDIADAITWAADNGAKVINMSLGSSSSCQTYEDAINYAWNKGAVLVATAGNNGDTTPRYPAYYPNVIAVAATDQNDVKASLSSYGSWVDVAAPGINIYSTLPGTYGYKSGTSMSAPFVSAVAGLIWSTPYGISNTAVRSRLETTAKVITGTKEFWKYGRVDAAKAVAYTAPSPTPTLNPASTKLQLSIYLHGIGKSGDNANPASFGNQSPKTLSRTVTLTFYNKEDILVLTKEATLTYDPTKGYFSGIVDLGTNFSTGVYTAKVATAGFLRKTIPGILSINSGQLLTIPALSLVAGDANGDNVLNILDYTLLVGCYSDLTPAKNCSDSKEKQTDFTDDGNVNQLDYNLFLRELSIQAGD